jgi:ABC-type spermidine/putrescine transport system permease subunit I
MRRAQTSRGRLLERLWPSLLAAPAALLWLAFLLGPLGLLVRLSLCHSDPGRDFYQPGTWTLHSYRELAGEVYFRQVLGFTLLLGVAVTLLTLLLAYPLALFIHGLRPRGRALALTAAVLPKFAGVLVVVFGLKLLLSNDGPVNRLLLLLGVVGQPLPLGRNLAGVVIGETWLLLPYAVLILVAALARIDPDLVPAARGLGATPWQAFRRITLPQSVPGLLVAGELTLLWSLGALVGPLLLGSPQQRTLAVEVQRQALEYSDWPRAAATAVVMLLALAACLALGRLATGWLRRADEVGP